MAGLTWSKATVPSGVTKRLSAVSFGGGTFSAVPGNGSDLGGAAAYSHNGTNWSKSDVPYIKGYYSGITYGNGKFVAVAGGGLYYGDDAYLAYSTNGVSWQRVSLSYGYPWSSVAYGGGKFVAVSKKKLGLSKSLSIQSSDGISWETAGISANHDWAGIAYGGGKFVAISDDGYFTYSTGDSSWSTPARIESSYAYHYIVYGNGYFIAVGTSKMAYSATGMGWATVTLPSTGTWGPIAYGNGRLVIVSTNTAKAIYSDSANGTTWTETSLPPFVGSEGQSWLGVTYGAGRFVAVGGGASSAIIAYSNDQLNSPPTTPGLITAPAEVYPGDNFIVGWGASTDQDGNLSGYDVQRAYDDSSTWAAVVSGTSSTSITTSVEDGHTSVQYRVRARDSSGATSAWRNSNLITIVNIKAYIGVDGKARAVRKIYVGIEGKAREIVKGYVGVNGVARRFL